MKEDLSFGQFIRQRRREMDLTQEELARRVGCAAITIRKIEAEDARPSIQIAERLAMALAIPLEERAEFVRRARAIRPEPDEAPTPPPSLEEIGFADLTGRAIRGYALSEKIGTGGMGVVYRATQPLVEREVAVKIILPAFANHPDFIRRFEAEAQLVARLEHPHIVPLYDYWREPGVAYLVMRLLRGGSVQGLLQEGSLPLETTTHILEQICSALNAAHRIGVIHRDLKPANILLDEDQNAYLADFGIAKNLGNPEISESTQMGAIIGSPHYMSPEQIRSLPVRPQTDIYCLGVMLYEMLTGKTPFTGPTPFDLIQQHISTPMPPLAAHRTGLPAALDQVIAHATAKEAEDRYTNLSSLLNEYRQALNGMNAKTVFVPSEEEIAGVEIVNPYKGLRAFSEADAEDFFGRETLVQQFLARLSEGGELARFLTVIGPSGSGKSSSVKAGLIPALRRGGLLGSENWFYVDLLPGQHPFEELDAALLRVAINPPISLLDLLKEKSRGLFRTVNRILPSDPTVELVLVIDQFEELFTLVADEEERDLFLSNLVSAVLDERSRVRVIITLRADFIDRPLRYVDFGELLQRRNELVLPLTPDELERAILGPAHRVGLKLESGLVSAIIRTIGSEPGALPLLQYALTELFDRRDGHTLTRKSYDEIGGVLGALGRRAEEIFDNLDIESQAITRQLFLRLVTLGEGTEDTRRRIPRTEVESLNHNQPALFQHVLEAFGKARLLSFDRDPLTRGATIEVAHEALLREWGRLQDWLNESRADVRLQRQLAQTAQEWQDSNCDVSFLLVGSHLEQFEGWFANTTLSLTHLEQSFLDDSIEERDRRATEEQARQQRELGTAQKLAETERQSIVRLRLRNRVITIIGAVALVLAVLAAFFAFYSNQSALTAQQQRNFAVHAQATAQAEAHVSATQRALAELNFAQAENQRLAAEAYRIASNPSGNSELAALLSIRSLKNGYTANADAALVNAMLNLHTQFVLNPQGSSAGAAAFSPDGTMIATGGLNQTIQFWDAKTGKFLRTISLGISGPLSGIPILRFSPDGKWLLAGTHFGYIVLFNAETGAVAQTYTGISQSGDPALLFSQAEMSPGGKLVLATSTTFLQLWESFSGKNLITLSMPDTIKDATFSADGHFILVGLANGDTYLLDATDGKQLQEYKDISLGSSVTFSPDGKLIAIGQQNGEIYLHKTVTGELLKILKGHEGEIQSLAFSPDGGSLLSGSRDTTVRLWDVISGEQLNIFSGHSQAVVKVEFSPDEQSALSSAADGEVRVWSIHANILNWHRPDDRFMPHTWAELSPKSQVMLIEEQNRGDELASLDFIDLDSNQLLSSINIPKLAYLRLSPNGKYVLLNQISNAGYVNQIWDIHTGRLTLELNDNKFVYGALFSPDNTMLITFENDGLLYIWDLKSGNRVGVIGNIRNYPYSSRYLDWSPNINYVASGDSLGLTHLFDIRSHSEAKAFVRILSTSEITNLTTTAVAFSADGSRLITGENDGRLFLWDIASGKLLKEFNGHTAQVWSVKFSPDDKYILSASTDKTVRLWDANTGNLIRTFNHTQYVNYADFSPDGKFIISSGGDGARLWETDYHDTINTACSLLIRDLTDAERAQYNITDTAPTCPKP